MWMQKGSRATREGGRVQLADLDEKPVRVTYGRECENEMEREARDLVGWAREVKGRRMEAGCWGERGGRGNGLRGSRCMAWPGKQPAEWPTYTTWKPDTLWDGRDPHG